MEVWMLDEGKPSDGIHTGFLPIAWDLTSQSSLRQMSWVGPKASQEKGRGMLGMKDSQKCPKEPCEGHQEESKGQGLRGKGQKAAPPGTGPGNEETVKGQGHCPWATDLPQGRIGVMCVSQALLPHDQLSH